MKTAKRLYLVDVSSLFFRAFYAIRPLSSPSGMPVNAIYGFLTMTLKLLKDEKPDSIVFCYDRPEPSFRKDLDPNYKANRSAMPEDLALQIPYIKKIGPLLGIDCTDKPGFEADDIIGTLTKRGRKNGYDVVIVSGDKDFAQLLEPGVVMYDTMKNARTGPDEALTKWGIRPDQMIDYLSIVGDTSDNIPGIRGLGEKGAVKLLAEFGNLDGIYKNIDSIKGATKDKLEKGKESAYLSQKLVTIVTDVDIEHSPEDFVLRPVDLPAVNELLADLNFKNLTKQIRDLPNYPETVTDVSLAVVESGEVALADDSSPRAPVKTELLVTTMVEAANKVSLNLEKIEVAANKLREMIAPGSPLWIFSISTGVFLHTESTPALYRISGEIEDWGKELSKGDYPLCGFDLKKIARELKIRDLSVQEDLQVAAYILAPGEGNSLSVIVSKYLNEVLADSMEPEDNLRVFLDLKAAIFSRLDSKAMEIYRDLDLPLVSILYKMEREGIRIDRARLAKQSEGLAVDIAVLEKSIHTLAGEEFNVASPKQLGHILFDVLKLPPSKKTKTGYSTDEDVLNKLKNQHPIANEILSYRELTKLKSTYVDSLPQMADEMDRIHSNFDQSLTATGRLSSRDPNLQNIPIRSERGAEVRRSFIGADGCELLSIDYSQIELRILAHYSEDANLIRAFLDDLDIHSATASEIFSVPLNDVTAEHRRAAKAVNFGIAYGQGAFGLAENLGIPRGEAQEIIQRYFHRFPGVGAYIENTIARAKEDGFVMTLFGRKRFMHELQSASAPVRKFGERAAINAPIQGTAADIVRKAMIDIAPKVQSKMILQVHDELIFEAPPDVLREEKAKIVSMMESVIQLKVPLKVNAAQGKNWDEAH